MLTEEQLAATIDALKGVTAETTIAASDHFLDKFVPCINGRIDLPRLFIASGLILFPWLSRPHVKSFGNCPCWVCGGRTVRNRRLGPPLAL